MLVRALVGEAMEPVDPAHSMLARRGTTGGRNSAITAIVEPLLAREAPEVLYNFGDDERMTIRPRNSLLRIYLPLAPTLWDLLFHSANILIIIGF